MYEKIIYDMYETKHNIHEKTKLKMALGKIFTDQIIWTRMFIVDLLNNSPSIDYTIDRLLKNQDAIGNYMKIYFGDTAGDSLTSILKEHVMISIDLLKAIRGGNITEAKTFEEQLVANVENISTFLSTINPYYSVEELIDMFNTHIILIKYQFIARMNGDYNGDIIYFDMGLHHILAISDYLAAGIFERFFGEHTEEQMIQTESEYELGQKLEQIEDIQFQKDEYHDSLGNNLDDLTS